MGFNSSQTISCQSIFVRPFPHVSRLLDLLFLRQWKIEESSNKTAFDPEKTGENGSQTFPSGRKRSARAGTFILNKSQQ